MRRVAMFVVLAVIPAGCTPLTTPDAVSVGVFGDPNAPLDADEMLYSVALMWTIPQLRFRRTLVSLHRLKWLG